MNDRPDDTRPRVPGEYPNRLGLPEDAVPLCPRHEASYREAYDIAPDGTHTLKGLLRREPRTVRLVSVEPEHCSHCWYWPDDDDKETG